MEAKTLFKRGLNTGSKGLSSECRRKLIDEGIKHAPELSKLGISKIKNKTLKNALDSDIESYIVQKTQKEAKEDLDILFGVVLKMTKGINSFQIEEGKKSFFKNIEDRDINNYFVGVFPSNYMNKLADHAAMISEKRENTHLP